MPRGDFDRSERKARTRERLLAAAASAYARRGFGGATLDEVAAEAGFTKGAVYSHFGSKENLLIALLEEHLAEQIAEQIATFDLGIDRWERPRAGSDRWMASLERDPDPFRLFVELWVYAQRDERLRRRLAGGLDAIRKTIARFAETGAAESGVPHPPQLAERYATVALALGIGLPMVHLIDPESAPTSLLGAVLSALIRSAERDTDVRELLAGAEGARLPA
jgi:AcrR family transcriptional regulator